MLCRPAGRSSACSLMVMILDSPAVVTTLPGVSTFMIRCADLPPTVR
jgi:hypothetical protein